MDQNVQTVEQPQRSVAAILRSGLLLAVSILLLVTAFLPIAQLRMGDLTQDIAGVHLGDQMDVGLTLPNSYQFFFDVMREESTAFQAETKLQEQIEAAQTDVQYYMERDALVLLRTGTASQELSDSIQRFMILSLRQSLRHESAKMSAGNLLSFALRNLYLVLTLALFVLALIDFLRALHGKKVTSKGTVTLLCAAAPLLLVVYFALFLFLGGTALVGMSCLAKAALWCVGLTLALLAAIRVGCGGLKVRELIKRLLTVVTCVLVIAMLFAPYFTSHVTGTFEGCTIETVVKLPVDASLFEEFAMSTDTEQEMNDLQNAADKTAAINEYLAPMLDLNTRELKETAYMYNPKMIVAQLCAYGGADFPWFFAFQSYLMVLCGLAAAIVLWQNCCELAGGKRCRVLCLTSKIVTAVLAAGILALSIVLTVIANINIATFAYYNANYALYLGAGAILLMLFALVLLFLPNLKRETVATVAPAVTQEAQPAEPIPAAAQ